jgi:enoyl-CoA hydratase/carnithine racemase
MEDFFTEEYALNHLIHNYPKPYIAFMDGIVMGGGMGISQGASLRVVTERTKMAMPETPSAVPRRGRWLLPEPLPWQRG